MSLRYTGEATMDETALRDVESWKDRIEVRLDNRQVFFLFFGSAIVACMLFVLGVIVGKRLEGRGRALAPIVEDPLATLDRFGAERGGAVAAPSALTFPRALLGGGSSTVPASHSGKTDKRAEEKRTEDRREDRREEKREEKKVEERAERAERAPSRTAAPARAALAEPAPQDGVPLPVASQPARDEGATSNRKLAALPRPLGAPGTGATVASRSTTTSGSREGTAPKTLASTVAPTSRMPAAVSGTKDAALTASPKLAATPQGSKPGTLTNAKAASTPLAKSGVPATTPRTPSVAPSSPPVRTAAATAPLKASTTAAAASTAKAAAAPARKGFLLQLSSFQDRSEADAFARRFASENAYVVPTDVPGKGTVYRVRVGSYANLKEAAAAKTNFEQTHNVIAYVAGTGPAE